MLSRAKNEKNMIWLLYAVYIVDSRQLKEQRGRHVMFDHLQQKLQEYEKRLTDVNRVFHRRRISAKERNEPR